MPYAVSTYSAGRTGSAPVAPLRASPPDRKPANALSREDEIHTDPPENRDNKASDAPNVRNAGQQQVDRRDTAERAASQAQDKQVQDEQAQNREASEASDRKREVSRETAAETAGERRIAAEQSQGRAAGDSRKAEQAAETERRRAQAAAELAKPEPKTTGPASQEDIKKLEQIRANALYPSPPSAESRELAQRAHVELIRAEAEIKAYELEQSRQKYRDAEAARFRRDQAAAEYRKLAEFDERERGLLH